MGGRTSTCSASTSSTRCAWTTGRAAATPSPLCLLPGYRYPASPCRTPSPWRRGRRGATPTRSPIPTPSTGKKVVHSYVLHSGICFFLWRKAIRVIWTTRRLLAEGKPSNEMALFKNYVNSRVETEYFAATMPLKLHISYENRRLTIARKCRNITAWTSWLVALEIRLG